MSGCAVGRSVIRTFGMCQAGRPRSVGHSCARDTTLLVKVGVFDMHQSVHVFLKKGRMGDISVMKLAD